MVCHVCQQTFKAANEGSTYSTRVAKFWCCLQCSNAMDRVMDLEDLLRQLRDRLYALQEALKEEPWMVRVANKAFQPTFPGLREAMGEVDTILWRKM